MGRWVGLLSPPFASVYFFRLLDVPSLGALKMGVVIPTVSFCNPPTL